MNYSKDNPWISEREITICCWESHKVRGDYTNQYASILPNVFGYSAQQMRDYIKMFKEFGFTGVQLLDTCYSWCQAGSVQAFHERLITMAKAAHELNMKVTLWIWASSFHGHGWYDPDVKYAADEGYTAYTDPGVRKMFEKYYDIYAELAPYVDMLIGHFFDPGHLTDYNDIISYMKLLESKFKAKNPDIRMAVDTWGAPPNYPEVLAESNLGNYLLLEQPSPDAWPGDSRAVFRRSLRENGFKVGMWGWYTTEYESDQLCSMYVNGHVLKERYLRIKAEGDHELPVSYWSEMEAYHLLNTFSVYCASQLLINPYREPDELLRESVDGIWSGESAYNMYYILKTIEDIRSGDSWDTYWWTKPNFRWGTGDIRADLQRINECVAMAELVVRQRKASVKFTLPFEPWVYVKLIQPHLEQMKLLAEFKIEMERLEKLLAERANVDFLYRELDNILTPIPDFNTWVGNFLQIERREQYRIAIDFCARAGIPVPRKESRFADQRRYALEKASVFQKGKDTPFLFSSAFISESYLAYSKYEAVAVMDSLYQDKLISYEDNGLYKLTNWRDYRFNFDLN